MGSKGTKGRVERLHYINSVAFCLGGIDAAGVTMAFLVTTVERPH
jgi:uncharacterized membrane protein